MLLLRSQCPGAGPPKDSLSTSRLTQLLSSRELVQRPSLLLPQQQRGLKILLINGVLGLLSGEKDGHIICLYLYKNA